MSVLTSWAWDREVRADLTVVSHGTDVTQYGVDSAGGTLVAVQHQRVGFVNARDTVISCLTQVCRRRQINTWKITEIT